MEGKELQIIDERELLGKHFVMYGTKEEPLFKAKDVAEWIGHSDAYMMVKNIDDDEKGTKIICTLGGVQQCLMLTEDGLYEVLMQSKKPIAKKFKKEVKKILKQVRQTGGYIPIVPEETNEQFLARAFIVAQNTIAERDKQLATAKEEIKKHQEQLSLQAHKVDFYDAVTKSDDLLSMKEATDILAIKGYGRNKVFALLRFKGIFNDDNMPYRPYIDKGYFVVKEHDYTTKYGNTRHNSTTYVTQKGLEFLRKVILKDMENKKESKGE